MDIGGTKLASGLVDGTGRILHWSTASTPRPALFEPTVTVVAELIRRELLAASSRRTAVRAVGIGSAGVIDHRTGMVVSANDTLPDWQGVDLRARVRALIGLPVSVDNDVNTMALAEARTGAARGVARAIFAAVGTGVGGAFLCDGTIVRGTTGTAGEIGHLPVGPCDGPICGCGRGGHLEAYASGPAIHRSFVELGGVGAEDFRDVARLAQEDDPRAAAAVTGGASILGRALAGLVNAFDPETVVVGGGVLLSGPVFVRPLRQAFRTELLSGTTNVALRLPRYRSRAGVIGAGMMALGDVPPHRLRAPVDVDQVVTVP